MSHFSRDQPPDRLRPAANIEKIKIFEIHLSTTYSKGVNRMAKRKRKTTAGAASKMGDLGGGGMAKKLQDLQQQMVDTQAALGDETLEVTAGGGVVTVEMSGHQKIKSLTIDPEVVDPEDVEMLQDLIIAAVNEAVEKTQAMASEQLEGLTGGLSIPGLF